MHLSASRILAALAALSFVGCESPEPAGKPIASVVATDPGRYDGVLGKTVSFKNSEDLRSGSTTTLKISAPTPGTYVFEMTGVEGTKTLPATYHFPPTEDELSDADHSFNGLAQKISSSDDARTLFKLTYAFREEIPIKGGGEFTMLVLMEKDDRYAIFPRLDDEGTIARNPNAMKSSAITIDWRAKELLIGIRYETSSFNDDEHGDCSVYADAILAISAGEIRGIGPPYLIARREMNLKSYASLLDYYYNFKNRWSFSEGEDTPAWLKILEGCNPDLAHKSGYENFPLSDGQKVLLPADFKTIAHVK